MAYDGALVGQGRAATYRAIVRWSRSRTPVLFNIMRMMAWGGYAFLSVAACGGQVDPGGDASTIDGNSDSTVFNDSSDSDDSSGDTGSPPCQTTSSNITHDSDGGCENAYEFGECNGDQYLVTCVCDTSTMGVCYCYKNNLLSNPTNVPYDCTACQAVGASWGACGYP